MLIAQCVRDKHIGIIKEAKTVKCVIDSLEKIFVRKSKISKLLIMKKLFELKFQNKNLQDDFMKVKVLLRELEAAGTKLCE